MNKKEKQILVKMGRKGGKKTAERGSSYFSAIGKKGAKSRWSKTKNNG